MTLDKDNNPVDKRVDRILKEFEIIHNTYLSPIQEGVKGVEIPGYVKKLFYDNLRYLEDSSENGLLEKVGEKLLKTVRIICDKLDFDYEHFKNSSFLYSPNEINLTKPLPIKGHDPYFVWHLTLDTIVKMKHNRPLTYNVINERILGTIVDSRDDIDPHLLKIQKNNLDKDLDTKLIIESMDRSEEMYEINYCMKEGKIVRITENGINSKFELAVNNAEHYLGVTPQHLRFYLKNSNLTLLQKGTLKELLSKLESFDNIKPEILFPGYGIKKTFSSRLGKFFF